MSKKQAERERDNLYNRAELLQILADKLYETAGQMSTVATCYPNAWHTDRFDIECDLRDIHRAVNLAVADLLSAAASCHHMDKHQRKREVSSDFETA